MAPKQQGLSDEERDTLAKALFDRDSWNELTTHEKRSCSAHGASAHRTGVSVETWLEEHKGGDATASGGGRKKK